MAPVDFDSILSPLMSGSIAAPGNSIWLVYAVVIIETVSSPDHITELWKFIVSHAKDDGVQLKIARRLREGLLKTSPLAGFPRVIISLCNQKNCH